VGGVQSARTDAIDANAHITAAHRYIASVLDGSIPSCKWVRLACERQLRDLKQSEDESYPYRFDAAAAERVCRFVELSPHIKGKKFAGKLIHLEDWQCFILIVVFGWLNKFTGLRRFRRAYSEIAKGNGKSALTSAVSNFMAFAEGEPGAEVYSAATNRDQAKIVWSVSHAMLRAMPEFCDRAGVDPAAHSINQLRTNSFFRPLSSDANSAEGAIPYFVCVDELHAHPTRDLYDNLDTANGKREGSLLWAITTAGSDRAGICYEVRSYITKVLEGVVQDDSVFGIIFTIDDEDEWSAGPEVWRKANPNWGISVDPFEIGTKIQRALQVSSSQPTIQTKHLNKWVNADHAWMDMQRWAKCADPTLDEADFSGQRCIIGLDLASKLDLLSKVKIFWKEISGKRHFYVFCDHWTPEHRVEHSPNSQYKGWVIDEWLHTCPGETNDYDIVEDSIRADCRTFEVLEVAHDQYQAVTLVNHLMPEGIEMVEIPQLPKYLSEPMKELEASVYDGRFHFNGDPILTWAMSNVVCHLDKNDNLFPTKETYEKKIDPVTAILTGLNRVMATPDGGGEAKFVFI
jgi:phage terminase large subunit-like protein